MSHHIAQVIMPNPEVATSQEEQIKEVYTRPAKQLRLARRFREAIDLLTQGLSNYPDSTRLLCSLGEVHKRMGEIDAARKLYQKALKIDPGNDVALNSIGHTYKLQGEHEKAMSCFEIVLAIKPNDAAALAGIGQTYLAQGDPDRAIECFRKILETKPNDVVASSWLSKLRD